MSNPVFLVSNDDGYRSAGIRLLADCAADLGDAYTVAPDREQSASSHSLTLHRPLRVEPEGRRVWAVDGTPTDCVHLGIRGGILPVEPTMVLSGINLGTNLGDEVTYSGTVAGAMEGCLLGLPAIAFSCMSRDPDGEQLDTLRPWIRAIIEMVLDNGLPRDTLLNVNFPDPRRGPIHGITATHQGKMIYGAQIVEKTDPRDRKYYWIGGEIPTNEQEPGSDVDAVRERMVSVTPIHMNLTDRDYLEALSTLLPSTDD